MRHGQTPYHSSDKIFAGKTTCKVATEYNRAPNQSQNGPIMKIFHVFPRTICVFFSAKGLRSFAIYPLGIHGHGERHKGQVPTKRTCPLFPFRQKPWF